MCSSAVHFADILHRVKNNFFYPLSLSQIVTQLIVSTLFYVLNAKRFNEHLNVYVDLEERLKNETFLIGIELLNEFLRKNYGQMNAWLEKI
ncbi:hypothetical protein BpHYR1_044940 [Brachionus plicatilis]|uniref:Uncharacterized protein n=1 Tax=Brachionus plicatilis TaxID=10195 RepID=A0A3M7S0N1_BRAPC|nr:hypothetical protein BpHYR1_044940 [Brachionus plicatilis]